VYNTDAIFRVNKQNEDATQYIGCSVDYDAAQSEGTTWLRRKFG
jgi:hypothetical protein